MILAIICCLLYLGIALLSFIFGRQYERRDKNENLFAVCKAEIRQVLGRGQSDLLAEFTAARIVGRIARGE